MSILRKTARFSHGIFFLEGSQEPEFASFGEHIKITATKSGLTIPCQHEQEGSTNLRIGTAVDVVRPETPAFDGRLDTPDREIRVTNVDLETIARFLVPNEITRIRVWLSRPLSATHITIGVD